MAQRKQPVVIERPEVNPHAGVIGWCHSCETVQMGDEARWRRLSFQGGWYDWACVDCDDEPWGLGVWSNSVGYWPDGQITEVAQAWLDSPVGQRWATADPCDHCGGTHLDGDHCANPPD